MLGVERIAVIGAGKLGETLIRGLLEAGVIEPEQIVVTTRHSERAEQVAASLGARAAASNAEAAASADLIILSVKPQSMPEVLEEIGPALRPGQLVISVAASVSTAFIEKHLPPSIPVVRAMPNTPCLLKQGMTGLAGGGHAQPEQVQLAKKIFDAVGRTVIVDEKHLDAVTGLSASGPAFLCIVVESMAEAGVKVGLPRSVATELAAQTMAGTGAMVLHTGEHPAKLKDFVTTPAGCTIDGILELEDGGLRVTLIKAVVKATARAKELLEV
jgi:pyrroline-5-carboxylate reductase